jgi:predicted amidohydrolase
MKSEDVRKAIEINKRLIAELENLKAEIDFTLRESRRRMEPVWEDLRRAGYLREPYSRS